MESTLRLYEFAPTRSIRVRWVLQELEVPFESVSIDLVRGENRSPAFLAISPAGKLPVLVDGDRVITESIAIVIHLAERFPRAGLLPTDPWERAQTFRWLLFAGTELEQPLWRIARHTSLYPEDRRLAADVPLAREDFTDMARVLEAHLEGRGFVVGERASVADFVTAYTLDWGQEVGLLGGFPTLRSYRERMYARPRAAPRIADALARIAR